MAALLLLSSSIIIVTAATFNTIVTAVTISSDAAGADVALSAASPITITTKCY